EIGNVQAVLGKLTRDLRRGAQHRCDRDLPRCALSRGLGDIRGKPPQPHDRARERERSGHGLIADDLADDDEDPEQRRPPVDRARATGDARHDPTQQADRPHRERDESDDRRQLVFGDVPNDHREEEAKRLDAEPETDRARECEWDVHQIWISVPSSASGHASPSCRIRVSAPACVSTIRFARSSPRCASRVACDRCWGMRLSKEYASAMKRSAPSASLGNASHQSVSPVYATMRSSTRTRRPCGEVSARCATGSATTSSGPIRVAFAPSSTYVTPKRCSVPDDVGSAASNTAVIRSRTPSGPATTSGRPRFENWPSRIKYGTPPQWSPWKCVSSTASTDPGSKPARFSATRDVAPQSMRKR